MGMESGVRTRSCQARRLRIARKPCRPGSAIQQKDQFLLRAADHAQGPVDRAPEPMEIWLTGPGPKMREKGGPAAAICFGNGSCSGHPASDGSAAEPDPTDCQEECNGCRRDHEEVLDRLVAIEAKIRAQVDEASGHARSEADMAESYRKAEPEHRSSCEVENSSHFTSTIP